MMKKFELWFYCNPNNVWKKSKSPIIYKSLLKSIIVKEFNLVSIHYNNLKHSTDDDALKTTYDKRGTIAFNVATKLKNSGFISSRK